VAKDVRLAPLRDQLRAEPPAALSRLTGDQIRDLTVAVEEARHRQAEELEAAGEAAFALVPRLLRAPVRRMLR
jgi:hypothetical protein